MVRQIVDRVSAVVRQEGISAALTKIVGVAGRAFKNQTRDDFDVEHQTDTWGEVPLWRLEIPSANARHGSKYSTTHPSIFFEALAMVPMELDKVTFVDLGCGKGRALILAAQRNFTKIVGVEFSPELAAIARRNVADLGIRADIIEMDVAEFRFPEGNLLVYMYNPFDKTVMHSVITNLAEWRAGNSGKGFLIYINPVCYQAIEAAGGLERVADSGDVRIWKVL